MQRLVVSAINRYQAKGGGREIFRVDCNFEPSCSEYAKQAVIRYGVVRGGGLAWQRVKRCSEHDCTSSQYDPVPLQGGSHV